GSSDIASKIRHQTPLMLQRLKRRNTLFQSPSASGRSRQGEPVRTIQRTPSTNIRLSRPVEPFWSGRPMISPEIRSQSASSNTKRSITPKTASPKAVLNHNSPQPGIPKSPQLLDFKKIEQFQPPRSSRMARPRWLLL